MNHRQRQDPTCLHVAPCFCKSPRPFLLQVPGDGESGGAKRASVSSTAVGGQRPLWSELVLSWCSLGAVLVALLHLAWQAAHISTDEAIPSPGMQPIPAVHPAGSVLQQAAQAQLPYWVGLAELLQQMISLLFPWMGAQGSQGTTRATSGAAPQVRLDGRAHLALCLCLCLHL